MGIYGEDPSSKLLALIVAELSMLVQPDVSFLDLGVLIKLKEHRNVDFYLFEHLFKLLFLVKEV